VTVTTSRCAPKPRVAHGDVSRPVDVPVIAALPPTSPDARGAGGRTPSKVELDCTRRPGRNPTLTWCWPPPSKQGLRFAFASRPVYGIARRGATKDSLGTDCDPGVLDVQREMPDIAAIVVGIALAIFATGFFRTSHKQEWTS
jgi:hypothetical protein